VFPIGANLNFRWYGISGASYQPLYSSNLVNWLPYDGAIAGTNGPIIVTVPIGSEPSKFFRFKATY